MVEQRKPYARTLAVLRALSWPYRYPPLSWYVRLVDWVAARNSRLIGLAVAGAAYVAWAVIFHG